MEQVLRDHPRAAELSVPPKVMALKVWATLHGLVSLTNTRVLPEVTDEPEQIVLAILAEITGG